MFTFFNITAQATIQANWTSEGAHWWVLIPLKNNVYFESNQPKQTMKSIKFEATLVRTLTNTL